VDELPESAVVTAWELLAPLRATDLEALPAILANAPWDDEDEPELEELDLADSDNDANSDDVDPHEQVRREFGW
jgi:hypothetical protein